MQLDGLKSNVGWQTEGSPMALRVLRVLIAEDDKDMRGLIKKMLFKDGFEVIEVENGTGLLDRLRSSLVGELDFEYDLVISDIRMPGATALEILENLRGLGSMPPVILITAFGDEETYHRARELGVKEFLDKPFLMADLRKAVRNVIPEILN